MRMTYEQMMEVSKKFYDTVDFQKFVQKGKENQLEDLMDCIDEFYLNRKDLLPESFQGEFFNFMTADEFSDYLCERYGWSVRTELIEKHYIRVD